MRCNEKENLIAYEYVDGTKVFLCEKHGNMLLDWYKENPGELVATKPTENTSLVPNRPTDTIKTHLEQAKELLEISNNFHITDQESYSAADEVLAIVHQGEKDLKAEKEKAKKPLRETGKVIDSWFKEPLDLYKEAKQWLKDRMSGFLSAQKSRQEVALMTGDHETAQQYVTDPSDHTRLAVKFDYAIENDGANLPLEFWVPDETKNDEIVKLLPRNLLRPNYDLISAIVKEHGEILEIPDVIVIRSEELVMKGGPKGE